jgi:hypothetical protein
MKRPAIEVADVIRALGGKFVERYQSSLSYGQLQVMRAVERCRTAALGGHLDRCSHCGHQAISYNSCRNRHCPKCQAQARDRWLAARQKELLPTSYFHLVFTVPQALNVWAQVNPRPFYQLLFQACAHTLLEVAADPKHLGAQIGFLCILHTWGQNLLLHPHLHCVIPAGGLSPDHSRWVSPPYPFFLPVKVLSRVFRGKFVAGLKHLYRTKTLRCTGWTAAFQEEQYFARFLRQLHRADWVVYAKPAFGGPQQVLRYLGRYTHRVAISNHRLLAFDGERITFRWKDYAHGGQKRKMTLEATEFLRRFLLHVLPRGFVRIRQFGLLANRRRGPLLRLCRQRLTRRPSTEASPVALSEPSAPMAPATTASPSWTCPQCGAPMMVVQFLTSLQLLQPCPFANTS